MYSVNSCTLETDAQRIDSLSRGPLQRIKRRQQSQPAMRARKDLDEDKGKRPEKNFLTGCHKFVVVQ
jgi:hypothetical protein